MRIERIEELLIKQSTNVKIQSLLNSSFPGYPSSRTYFKQIPHSRLLVWVDEHLVGHAALEYRMISVNQHSFKVFLIGDICVDTEYQHQNIATSMVSEIEKIGRASQLDFLLVAVTNTALYQKNGFSIINNPCRWVIIQNYTTIGVRQRSLDNTIMVKKIGKHNWQDGVIDFLGYIV